VRWVSKSRVVWLTLEEMHEPGPHAHHEDQEGRPVTTNNDTPPIFGDHTHDHPQDAGPFATEHDDDDFPPFRGWAGWGDRVEPVAPDDDDPEPSFSPYEQDYPQQRPAPGQPGYPHGPGYAPDSAYRRRLVYPQDLGFAGDVYVAGLTLEQVERKISQHLTIKINSFFTEFMNEFRISQPFGTDSRINAGNP